MNNNKPSAEDRHPNEEDIPLEEPQEVAKERDDAMMESEPQKEVEEDQLQKMGFFQTAASPALRPFVIISVSYLLFTVTDGAIRMIVLLHAYNKSFSAWQVAVMFVLYETAGVFTNLAAGIMGAKWGIKTTLLTGLVLQLFSYGLLFGWQRRLESRDSDYLCDNCANVCRNCQGSHQTGWQNRDKASDTRREDTRSSSSLSVY